MTHCQQLMATFLKLPEVLLPMRITIAAFVLLMGFAFASSLWTAQADGGITTDPLILDNQNRVLVGTSSGYVQAFSLSGGQEAWSVQAGDYIEDLVLFKGDIVSLSRDGNVTRLRNDGVPIWSTDLAASKLVGRTTYGLAASPSQLFATTDAGIVSIDGNGNVTVFYSQNATYTKPVLNDPYLIVGIDDYLSIFRISSQEIEWQQRLGPMWESTPLVSGGNIVLGTLDNRIYMLRLGDGFESWRVETDGWILSPPQIDGSDVFVGSNDGFMYAINTEDGQIRWKGRAGKAIQTSLRIVVLESGAAVIAGSQDGRVYAFDRQNGETVWTWEGKDWVTSIAGYEGRILAGLRNGELYLLQPDQACTITSPASGTVVGQKEIKLKGYGFPPGGGTQVQISINSGSWQTVGTGGPWSYIISPDGLNDGKNLIRCQVAGQVEPFLFELRKDSALPIGRLLVSYPVQAAVNEDINITVIDEETLEPVEGYTLALDGNAYTGDAEGKVLLKFPEPRRLAGTLSKSGFEEVPLAIEVVNPNDMLPTILPIAGVLVVVGLVLFFVIKRFRKAPAAE